MPDATHYRFAGRLAQPPALRRNLNRRACSVPRIVLAAVVTRLRNSTLMRMLVAMMLFATGTACITPRYPEEPKDPTGQATVGPRDLERERTPFCRNIDAITSELREMDSGVRCVSMDYSEAGTFGHEADPTQSSFREACFAGFDRYESRIVNPDKPIGGTRTAARARLEIDAANVLDLSEYGVSPARYQFHGVKGPLAGQLTVVYRDVAVRSVKDMGYVLPRIRDNAETSDDVRKSISSCMSQLCAEETFFTEDIYSARPEVHITLRRGSAERLRPIPVDAKVQIARGAVGSFIVRPLDRIDLAAKVSRSRDHLAGQRACRSGPPVIEEPRRRRSSCGRAKSSGFEADYQGCTFTGRTLTCELVLTSIRKDRMIDLYVASGNNKSTYIVDSGGAYHVATDGSVANQENRRFVSTKLIADHPTPVRLEFKFDGNTGDISSLSVLDIRLGTQRGIVPLEFRNLPVGPTSCRSQLGI